MPRAARFTPAQGAGKTHVAWELRRGGPETPSLLYVRGRLYLLRHGGPLTCLEASTGKEISRKRIGAPGQYTASPIAANEKVIVASVPGIVPILQAGGELKVPARNHFNEEIWAAPAIADNRIYLRTAVHLYALGK